MTDKQFDKKLSQTVNALYKYQCLLQTVEKEYVRRYGVHPSAVDDDLWIDTFHYGQGSAMNSADVE